MGDNEERENDGISKHITNLLEVTDVRSNYSVVPTGVWQVL